MIEKDKILIPDGAEISLLTMDNGKLCEIFLPENPRQRLVFENEFCQFKPVGWARLNEIWYPLGYKVVTNKMESLGLRNNPTIMTFPIGEWIYEKNELEPNEADHGGIWTAQRKGSIKTLKEHCWNTWGMKTRGYLTAMDMPIFANDYRIKSLGVILLKEIH